ncbi:MAG: outer membrane protein assembly factor BamD [Nitrospinaceae bacterium]|nr:outer membrane protein assembly factor BamD [Nitrospinaceae bacterium]
MKRIHPGMVKNILVISFLALIATGCISRSKEQATPGELFVLGQQDLRSDRFEAARQAFKRLLREYPDSKHRRTAPLNLADSYFQEEEYLEAKVQYSEFVQLYPVSPHTSKAYFFLGMSDFNRILDFDRDQSIANDALKSFRAVKKRFPRSKFSKKSDEKIKKIRSLLASSELFIANFYLRRGQRVSAIPRYRDIIKNYRDQPEIRAEAIYQMGESFRLEESYEKAGQTYRILIEEHPTSPFSQDAYDRLLSLTSK